MKVRDLMTTDVIAVAPDTPVHEIARLMGERAISGIPVVGESWKLIGMVTDLDLIVRNTRLEPPAFFAILDGGIPIETPGHYRKRLQHMLGALARDVMTEKVVTIGPEEDAEALAALMVKRGVDPVPVVEAERLVGVVSRADIVRLMAREVAASERPVV